LPKKYIARREGLSIAGKSLPESLTAARCGCYIAHRHLSGFVAGFKIIANGWSQDCRHKASRLGRRLIVLSSDATEDFKESKRQGSIS
jgi:hypothetical protein